MNKYPLLALLWFVTVVVNLPILLFAPGLMWLMIPTLAPAILATWVISRIEEECETGGCNECDVCLGECCECEDTCCCSYDTEANFEEEYSEYCGYEDHCNRAAYTFDDEENDYHWRADNGEERIQCDLTPTLTPLNHAKNRFYDILDQIAPEEKPITLKDIFEGKDDSDDRK